MRTKLRGKFWLLFMICGVLIAVPGAAALAQDTGTSPAPTIQSDKADYAPGELVTLNGSGWQPGESVHINVNDTYGATWTRNVDVIADASGNITDSFNLPDWFVSDYDVTATGGQSGTARATFTDSNPSSLTVGSPTSVSVTQGSTATYGNVTVGFTGNSTPCNLTLSSFTQPAITNGSNQQPADTGLPTGANAVFGTGTLQGVGGESKTSTLAVSTTNSTPTGTYTFHVKGTRGTGCQGSDPVSQTLTLVVTSGDTTAPTVSSINRANANPTNTTGNLSWNVTFSENVTGVDRSDFQLAATGLGGSPAILADSNGVTGSGANYIVAVSSGTGDGTLGLNLVDDNSIKDGANNLLVGASSADGSFTGQVYTIDRTAANVTLTDVNGAARAFPYLTNQNVASLGGSCEPSGSPVHVTYNGGPTSPPSLVPCSPSGSWTVNLMPPVSTDGVHNFAASQVDAAGNSGSSGNKPVQIDKKAPSFNCDSADSDWHAENDSINCTANDGGSGLNPAGDASFQLSTTVVAGNETNNASTGTKALTDTVGNSATAGPISGNKVDRKAPVLTDDGPTPANPNGANNWYTSAVTNKFTATDGGSGFGTNGNPTKSITISSGTAEGSAVKIASGAVSDAVGNSAASIDSAAFKIDLSDPTNVTFVGGPAANGSYDFGDTPAKPTCTANDAVSGVASCDVTGYSTAVGTHTMTATAKDNAGRTATATRQYTVKAWTFKGFYQPVDMNDTVNTVKSGSTVPIKFDLLKGTTELTDTANVKQPLQAQKISCTTLTGDPEDLIEMTVTAGTSLRYDTTGGQFIYNWRTPTGAGTCYKVTISSLDGSSQTAYFKLK